MSRSSNPISSSDKTVTFIWEIENFDKTFSENQLKSPKFYSPDNSRLPFNLTFYPNGVKFPGPTWTEKHVFIYLWADTIKDVIVQYRLSILDKNGIKFNPQEGFTYFTKSTILSGWQYSISRQYLQSQANNLILNGKLRIHCEVNVVDGLPTPETSKSQKSETMSQIAKLSEDFHAIFKSRKHSDFVLVVDEKTEYPCHKVVLSARSKVFAAMFEHDCEERRMSRVEITDIDAKVLEPLLQYIYTGKVDSIEQYAMDLLAAADKYQIECLKSLCEEYLSTNLTFENSPHILLLADLHNATELKVKCIDFITESVSKVKNSDGWNLLIAKPELVTELLLHLAQKTNH